MGGDDDESLSELRNTMVFKKAPMFKVKEYRVDGTMGLKVNYRVWATRSKKKKKKYQMD